MPTLQAPEAIPLFGIGPHTPGRCDLARANAKAGKPCPTCGRTGPRPGSILVCMDCHRGSAETEAAARRHALPRFEGDRRNEPKDNAPVAKLTARQVKALLADARKGEQCAAAVAAFLAAQACAAV